jgi:hypothetical protein
MRTIEIELFKFEELSEEAQQKTIEKLYHINVSHDWYDFTYEDAKRIGLKINGFDLGRGESIDIEMLFAGSEVAEGIMEEHGEKCESFVIAKKFDARYKELDNKMICNPSKSYESFEEETEEIDEEFKKEIAREYLEMLRSEYEYLTSEEAIKETIIANDYEFTVEGGDIY